MSSSRKIPQDSYSIVSPSAQGVDVLEISRRFLVLVSRFYNPEELSWYCYRKS